MLPLWLLLLLGLIGIRIHSSVEGGVAAREPAQVRDAYPAHRQTGHTAPTRAARAKGDKTGVRRENNKQRATTSSTKGLHTETHTRTSREG